MISSRAALTILSLLVFEGCAHYPLNDPLGTYDSKGGYRFDALAPGEENTDGIFVCLAFSGGGTRAAALAYGVLQELRDTTISIPGSPRPLLAEVDCISSVSGGSFTASYYALFRNQMFQDFEMDFLRRNIQGELAAQLFNPWNWVRLLSPYFSRIDLASELYEGTVFKGKRYRHLNGGARPFIILNATNMSLGSRFEFTQEQFDFLGSDLGKYPIARAVAASSAFPILLNPISLKNHEGPLEFRVPTAVANALEDGAINARRYLWARNLALYQDKADRPFLHLLDGGLADNIGLRAVGDAYTRGFIRRRLNDGAIKTLVIIAVNARTDPAEPIDRRERPPGVVDVVMKTMTVSMENYSFETVEFMRSLAGDREQAQRDLAACQRILDARCPGGERLARFASEVDLHVVEINFEQLSDPGEREFFLNLPTTFSLTDHQVDCLIAAGRKLLRASAEYRDLLRVLGGARRPGAEAAAEFPAAGCKASE